MEWVAAFDGCQEVNFNLFIFVCYLLVPINMYNNKQKNNYGLCITRHVVSSVQYEVSIYTLYHENLIFND